MAASEALEAVALAPSDVAGGLALSSATGWNQTAEDWAFFIAQGHAVGYRTAAGLLIATAAAVVYGGGLGWISMVLVAPKWRHRGLASLLMAGTIRRLQALHVVPVLDATPAGQPVYRQLGFRAGFGLERWEGIAGEASANAAASAADEAVPASPRGTGGEVGPASSSGGFPSSSVPAARSGDAGARAAGLADLDAIAALDQAATGLGRHSLLHNLLARAGTRAWLAVAGDGFVIARTGYRAAQVGPLVAPAPGAALALLATALRGLPGPVFLDVPVRWAELAAWLERRGFTRQRPFVRMALAPRRPLECGDRLFVLAGPEFG